MRLEVAAALIFDERGRVFVQRRSPDRRLLPDCWDIVGGHVEAGENTEQAMRREVFEETGWTVSAIHSTLDPIAWTGEDGIERLETDYLVSVSGDLLAPRLEPGKHTEWRWISAAEVSQVDQRGLLGDQLIRELIELGFARAHQIGLVPG
jgi:8-oxo-dGTP diphosphatase